MQVVGRADHFVYKRSDGLPALTELMWEIGRVMQHVAEPVCLEGC